MADRDGDAELIDLRIVVPLPEWVEQVAARFDLGAFVAVADRVREIMAPLATAAAHFDNFAMLSRQHDLARPWRTIHDAMQPGTRHGDFNRFLVTVLARPARSPDELVAAARPLASYESLTTFREPRVARCVRARIATQDKARVRAELDERYAAACVAAWRYIEHNRDTAAQLWLDDLPDWLRRWARTEIAASLPLPPPSGDRLVFVDPQVLEEPGLIQEDPTVEQPGIDVEIATAAEWRTFLVVDGPEATLHRAALRLHPQELALARRVERLVRGRPPDQRAAVLADPAEQRRLAKALHCSPRALATHMSRLRKAWRLLGFEGATASVALKR